MFYPWWCAPNSRRTRLASCVLALAVLEGCSRTQTAEEARDLEPAESTQFQLPTAVAKFAGRVTVDGKAPKRNCRLFVILNDPKPPADTAHGEGATRFTACDADGNFAFSTYGNKDGVVPGKYVVTFVELHRPINPSSNIRFLATVHVGPSPDRYRQPDELKNLYNDPDKNVKNVEFNLELEAPGNAHYHFDLAVAGKKPVVTPGPKAVTGVAATP
jgi:hypothetical protein